MGGARAQNLLYFSCLPSFRHAPGRPAAGRWKTPRMQQIPHIKPPRRTISPGSTARFLLALGTLFLAVGFTGCKKDADKGTVLAQVGNATLTLEELRESFPAEYEQLIRREQYLDFIKRWIDDEVLYQQAIKGRLGDDPQVKRKIDKLLRKMLIEEFLSRENSSEAFEPDEMAMNQYYEMHRDEFRRKVTEVKYAHIRLPTLKLAAEIKSRIQTDNNFLAQATTHSQDPVPESYSSLTFKKQSEVPACLANEVQATRIGANSVPITCPDGIYLVRILDRQEAGSMIPFPEAKEEISANLAMERKDKLLDGRIATYKEGIAISYNLDQIPGLTETSAAAPAPGPAEAPSTTAPATAAASAATAAGAPSPATSPSPSSQGSMAGTGPAALEAPETAQAAPVRRAPRRRPRPTAAPAGAVPATGETSAAPSQPAAETAVPEAKSVQEENANAQKPDVPLQ